MPEFQDFETCLRCPNTLMTAEDFETGICAQCWLPEDELDGEEDDLCESV